MSKDIQSLGELPQEWPGALHYDKEEVEAVSRVARSRSPFRFYGQDLQKEVDQFEKEFESGTYDRLGTSYLFQCGEFGKRHSSWRHLKEPARS